MAEYYFVEQPTKGAYPITEEDLGKVEREFHFSFPRVLKDYYLKYNGCEIIYSQFRKGTDSWDVYEMCAIGKGRWDIAGLIRRDREAGYIADYLIPLADDSLNGTYYWDTRDEKIYLTYYEYEDDFRLLCTGIDTFFDILNHACKQQDEDNLFDITEYSKER